MANVEGIGVIAWLSCLEKPKTAKKIADEWNIGNAAQTFNTTKNKADMDAALSSGLLKIEFTEERGKDDKKIKIVYYSSKFEKYFESIGEEDKYFNVDKKLWSEFWSTEQVRRTLFKTTAISGLWVNKENVLKSNEDRKSFNAWFTPGYVSSLIIGSLVWRDMLSKDSKEELLIDEIKRMVSGGSSFGSIKRSYSIHGYLNAYNTMEFKALLSLFDTPEIRNTNTYQILKKENEQRYSLIHKFLFKNRKDVTRPAYLTDKPP